MRAVQERHPTFKAAVRADVAIALRYRSESASLRSGLDVAYQAARLCLVADTFFAQCCYRAKASLQRRGFPVVPRILHHIAVSRGGICIGDPVAVEPGVYIPHGQVVVDGFTRVLSGTVLSPFVTVGLRAGDPGGPVLGENTYLGTGAKVFGRIDVGAGAKVGANAVVTTDIPPRATAVGVPARVVGRDAKGDGTAIEV